MTANTLRTAAQAVVDAWPTGFSRRTHDAMDDLRAALAQPEPAPTPPVALPAVVDAEAVAAMKSALPFVAFAFSEGMAGAEESGRSLEAVIAHASAMEDPIMIPRGLVGAACSALERARSGMGIDDRRRSATVLDKLRHYTVGNEASTRPAPASASEPAMLPCGHPASLMLKSAETGEALYCECCDAQSRARDAETREAELQADLVNIRSAWNKAEEELATARAALSKPSGASTEVQAPIPQADGTKLWLWKNGDHFLAFEHLYPCFTPGGDPMVLGEPAGHAIFKQSFDRNGGAR